MSVAERKEREKQQRHNDIVDAAEKRFFEKGFDGVSMDEIARDLELSKPTLYLYFDNKESLFLAVALRAARQFVELYRGVLSTGLRGDYKIAALGDVAFNFSRKYPDYHRLLLFASSGRLDLTGTPEGRAYQETLAETNEIMCAAIKEGMDDGSIRGDMDPLEITIYLSLVADAVTDLRPDIRTALESRGIDYPMFLDHVRRLMGNGYEAQDQDVMKINQYLH